MRGPASNDIGAAMLLLGLVVATSATAAGTDGTGLSDEPRPFLSGEALAARTAPPVELGDPFLGTGNLSPGFTLPTGAVWQPRLWLFGNARFGVASFDRGPSPEVTEAVARLDLFANLQLTGTERLLVGVQPLHEQGSFSHYQFRPDSGSAGGFENHTNLRVRTLFFEGELAELFPRLDASDETANDIGFSIGRQPISFQEGIVLNDTIDALGVTRNSLRLESFPGLSNLRITGLVAVDEIHRSDNREDPDASLLGLSVAADTRHSTIEFDLAYVDSDDSRSGDLLVTGLGAIARVGLLNTAVRVNASITPDDSATGNRAVTDDGVLLFVESSWTPLGTHDIVYANGFLGIDHFRSAARDPLAGGPLGRTGLLYAARGLGRYPAALGNQADESAGLAIGYQKLFDGARRHLVLEAGIRRDWTATGFDAAGLAAQVQQAFGRRTVLRVDAFVVGQERRPDGYGIGGELQVKF